MRSSAIRPVGVLANCSLWSRISTFSAYRYCTAPYTCMYGRIKSPLTFPVFGPANPEPSGVTYSFSSPPLMKTILLRLLCLAPLLCHAQEIPTQDQAAAADNTQEAEGEELYQLKSSHTVPLPDGKGRRVILQRVKPLVLPPEPVVAAPVPVDPVVLAARRAARVLERKKDRRVLSLTGIYYPNGQTLLHWFMQGPDGQWTTYEAWTLLDVRAAWLVRDIEVGNTVYYMFPSVHPASKWDRRSDLPGPLWFPEGAPQFRLTKGDPMHLNSIAPVAELLAILQEEGPALTTEWLARKAAHEAEEARLKANPPPVEDVVISISLLKSNRHPEAAAEVQAAKAEGIRLAQPR